LPCAAWRAQGEGHAPSYIVLPSSIAQLIEGRFSVIRFGKKTAKSEVSFSSYELLEALMNGLIFHSEPRHVEAIGLLQDTEPWQYLWLIVQEIIRPVFNASVWLVNLIRNDELIDEGDFRHGDEGA
jgi:hypothetical protein